MWKPAGKERKKAMFGPVPWAANGRHSLDLCHQMDKMQRNEKIAYLQRMDCVSAVCV